MTWKKDGSGNYAYYKYDAALRLTDVYYDAEAPAGNAEYPEYPETANVSYQYEELPDYSLFMRFDLFSRKLVGWSMSESLSRQIAIDALEMAIAARNPAPGLIHHSDRGVQYACGDYQRIIRRAGMRPSMSRKGDCWDNSVAESFYASNAPLATVDPTGLQDYIVLPRLPGLPQLPNPDPLPFQPPVHTLVDDMKCVKGWMDWWKRNHPWDKKHPPKYVENMDKVGHCFVTCKAMKDCGLNRKCALGFGAIKELVDYFGKIGADADDMAANRLGADIAGRKGSNCLPDCLKAVQGKYGGVPPRWTVPHPADTQLIV